MSRFEVRPLDPERTAELLAKPRPPVGEPTKYKGLTDTLLLDLEMNATLNREDSLAVQEEMSRRGLYGEA